MESPNIKLSPKDYWAICTDSKFIDQVMEQRPVGAKSFIPTINGTEILMEQGVETIGLESVKRNLGFL